MQVQFQCHYGGMETQPWLLLLLPFAVVSLPLRGDGDLNPDCIFDRCFTFQCQYGGMETFQTAGSLPSAFSFQCHYGGMETSACPRPVQSRNWFQCHYGGMETFAAGVVLLEPFGFNATTGGWRLHLSPQH